VLVGVVPGEQHRVGIAIVEELLRRDGCEVVAAGSSASDDLIENVGAATYDAVALSVSCDSRLGTLPGFIKTLRRASQNPHLHVLVGGPAIAGDFEVARKIGADATALDGWQAVLHMRLLKRSVALQHTRTIQDTGPERDLPHLQG
jgi:methanogenic corrinoid protein MtbC1